MQCPKCQFENRIEAKFCGECGHKFKLSCPKCGTNNRVRNKFCDECGYNLQPDEETSAKIQIKERLPFHTTDKSSKDLAPIKGERKHVTVLFSDLIGYTAIYEKLDPEDVKDITTQVFDEISKVITKYDGFIEKYAGDAVMALFGATEAHEDDPIRAINAAREIHSRIETISPYYEEKICQPLVMHTGINTGLVITGDIDMERGTHGVSGDAINVASRLSALSKMNEVLVGPETYRLSEGYFNFEKLELIEVKGKAEPIQVYKVLSAKETPEKLHRLSGFRADLIGRKAEMALLADAAKRLRAGRGSIISICGAAGTGKSRLVEEFKATLDLEETQWLEGHAYAYAQNIPYFPMVDFLNRVFQIKEGDSPKKVREKIESAIQNLVLIEENVTPYVGILYSLSYSKVDNVTPEVLKSKLQDSLQSIISSLAKKAPTVFFLEDLHWADRSSVELFCRCLLEIQTPAIVLCAYRPPFSLFTSNQLTGINRIYQEILLQDLSLSEAQNMLESLLKTDAIPYDLNTFVQEKSEGNPFYLEELVNSLIFSNALVMDKGTWQMTKSFSELDISSSINGVISSRLDRLDKEKKRILQEASVIGRAFLYEILTRITDLKQDIGRSINGLEQLDLIKTRTFEPDLEYIFKHALTQEVVYNGLLKKERQTIHKRIGLVMEKLFQNRLPEFYETLAVHFKEGNSVQKAVDYLSKSGQKSFKKSALEESHRYFKDAFEILTQKSAMTKADKDLLIDLLVKWAFVFLYEASFQEMADLFSAHIDVAESLDDSERLGKFYTCLGLSLQQIGNLKDSYKYLHEAFRLCEQAGNQKFTGYSCAWLAGTCAESGRLDEAKVLAKKGQEIAKELDWDPIFFIDVFGFAAHVHNIRGEIKDEEMVGKTFMDEGKKRSDHRLVSYGYFRLGSASFTAGDFTSAIELLRRPLTITKDPLISYYCRLLLGWCYLSNDLLVEAKKTFDELMDLSDDFSNWILMKTSVEAFLALILIYQGNLTNGLKILRDQQRFFLENEFTWRYAVTEYLVGRVYLGIVKREGSKSLSLLAKNLGFLVRNAPFASKKAEYHFHKAIQVAGKIHAKGILGQAYLDLGSLYKTKKRTELARNSINKALQLFDESEAEMYLNKAKEALRSLQ